MLTLNHTQTHTYTNKYIYSYINEDVRDVSSVIIKVENWHSDLCSNTRR